MKERVAAMNPDAVEEAKVYRGPVHYFADGRSIDLPQTTLVEVGKWETEGAEHSPDDYLCTYYAALLLGFTTEWLPHNEQGERKLFVVAGINENSEIVSFSEERATQIAGAINEVYEAAKTHRVNLMSST